LIRTFLYVSNSRSKAYFEGIKRAGLVETADKGIKMRARSVISPGSQSTGMAVV